MDLKHTASDIDITNGELSFVTGLDAVRQDIEMTLRTFLEETPYDRSAGVPYLQLIFRKSVTAEAVRFILLEIVLAIDSVTEVLQLDVVLDRATRELTLTGRARALNEELDFTVEVAA